jgi:hypothetical protein
MRYHLFSVSSDFPTCVPPPPLPRREESFEIGQNVATITIYISTDFSLFLYNSLQFSQHLPHYSQITFGPTIYPTFSRKKSGEQLLRATIAHVFLRDVVLNQIVRLPCLLHHASTQIFRRTLESHSCPASVFLPCLLGSSAIAIDRQCCLVRCDARDPNRKEQQAFVPCAL